MQVLKKRIREVYAIDSFAKVDYSTLGLYERLLIAAILRAGLSEDTSKILGTEIKEAKVSPLDSMTKEFLEKLIDQHIILVDPDSPIDAFEFDENDNPCAFYLWQVNYLLNVQVEGIDSDLLVEKLEYPMSTDFYQLPKERLGLWRQIALAECEEFLLYRMDIVGFKFNPGEKTHITLSKLLEYFSVGQIWCLIYSSVAYSSQWYLEGKVSQRQAANSVITRLESRGEKAIAEGWKLKAFSRNYDLPESTIARTFYDSILKIGNAGIEKVPSISLIGSDQDKEEEL